MKKFEEIKFNIPALKGISAKNIEEHLKLYAGYVSHCNLVLEKISELSTSPESNMGILSGLQKRFGFEYNGMRNHEVYFNSLSGKTNALAETSELKKAILAEWESFEKWVELFQA